MTVFRRQGDLCVASFAPDEVQVLRKVASEVVGLLTEGFDRRDPVVGRLFPTVYPSDPAGSAEFRRYTETELKTKKIDQAGAILAALPESGGAEVQLDDEAAEAWLRALTDARLAMAIRLDITAETDLGKEIEEAMRREPTSARAFQLSVYAYLGYLQESLLEALTAERSGATGT
ncbi:MAG TPA: DUF2017 domain-containing protein [Micromonospora sp.]